MASMFRQYWYPPVSYTHLGADASASGFPDLYSESVTNFPAMRGFDCIPCLLYTSRCV